MSASGVLFILTISIAAILLLVVAIVTSVTCSQLKSSASYKTKKNVSTAYSYYTVATIFAWISFVLLASVAGLSFWADGYSTNKVSTDLTLSKTVDDNQVNKIISLLFSKSGRQTFLLVILILILIFVLVTVIMTLLSTIELGNGSGTSDPAIPSSYQKGALSFYFGLLAMFVFIMTIICYIILKSNHKRDLEALKLLVQDTKDDTKDTKDDIKQKLVAKIATTDD